MAIEVIFWLSKRGSYINKTRKKTEAHIILPGTIIEVQIHNICEITPTQDQGC